MSRITRILENLMGANNVLEAPRGRIEEILISILSAQTLDLIPRTRIEELLIAVKNQETYSDETYSRAEAIIKAHLDGDEYTDELMSEYETLLYRWLNGYKIHIITGREKFTATENGKYLINKSKTSWMVEVPDSDDELGKVYCEFAETKTYNEVDAEGETSGIGVGTNGYVIIGSYQYSHWEEYAGLFITYKENDIS